MDSKTYSRLPFLVILLGVAFFFSSADLYAQEHSFEKEDHENQINFEFGGHLESQGAHIKNIPLDSLGPVRPMISRPRPKQSEARNHEDEDALKFNFLYFIIQKFKFSDIIE